MIVNIFLEPFALLNFFHFSDRATGRSIRCPDLRIFLWKQTIATFSFFSQLYFNNNMMIETHEDQSQPALFSCLRLVILI